MDGPTDYIVYESSYEDNPDKQFQVQQLLVRNKKYMSEVNRIRKKYAVGEYPIEGDNPEMEELYGPTDPAERQAFFKDIKRVANKITAPGDWVDAVKDHVLGFQPEDMLVAFDEKRIIATPKDDHVELKIYGDITVPELRQSLKKVREFIELQRNDEHPKAKRKSRLDKNLIVYDLAQQHMSYNDIAAYCEEHKLQYGMQQADVSKYIELAQKQIANIYA